MKTKLINSKNDFYDISLVRWAIVGSTTTVVDYSIFISLCDATGSIFGSNLVASVLAALLNYLAHHNWTFKSNQQHLNSGVKYLLNISFWLIVSSLIIKSLLVVGIDPKVSKLIPLIFSVPINYLVLNKLVFGKKD
jgi:putative flippase GtrA